MVSGCVGLLGKLALTFGSFLVPTVAFVRKVSRIFQVFYLGTLLRGADVALRSETQVSTDFCRTASNTEKRCPQFDPASIRADLESRQNKPNRAWLAIQRATGPKYWSSQESTSFTTSVRLTITSCAASYRTCRLSFSGVPSQRKYGFCELSSGNV